MNWSEDLEKSKMSEKALKTGTAFKVARGKCETNMEHAVCLHGCAIGEGLI